MSSALPSSPTTSSRGRTDPVSSSTRSRKKSSTGCGPAPRNSEPARATPSGNDTETDVTPANCCSASEIARAATPASAPAPTMSGIASANSIARALAGLTNASPSGLHASAFSSSASATSINSPDGIGLMPSTSSAWSSGVRTDQRAARG
jgi:hypothetical protein